MKKARITLKAMSIVALCLLLTSIADAQAQRTFVSTQGKDSNLCDSPEKACRSISSAITKVQARGEVVVLDSGSYQPFTVNKALTVVAPPGVHAGITAPPDNNGALISTPDADQVILRGLTFNRTGGNAALGHSGIVFLASGGLHIENCVINGFDGGIFVGGGGRLYVKDTVARNNAGSGLVVSSTIGTARVVVDRCRFENNGNGVFCNELGSARLTIRDSIASDNTFAGFSARIAPTADVVIEINIENCLATGNQAAGIAASNVGSGSAGTTIMSVSNTTIAHNFQGIFCGTGGIIRVSNATITRNEMGLSVGGDGNILSRGNNTVEANNADGFFTGTFLAK